MKKIISRILIAYALAVLLCTLYLNQCIAQNPKQNKTSLSEYSVRGKVTDTHNVPMPGVTVRYNHIIGTATDNDGNFTLRLPEETAYRDAGATTPRTTCHVDNEVDSSVSFS